MRVSPAAAVFLTAVQEYLSCEVLELAGNCARDKKRKRINPDDVYKAVECDDELKKFVGPIMMPDSTPTAFIHAQLIKKKKKR